MNIFAHYEIFIDGKFRGLIKYNEPQEFEVENGDYVVRAEIDWCSSNELCVHVNDSIVELEVGNSMAGWRVVFWQLYISIWKDKYLWLKVRGPETEAERARREKWEKRKNRPTPKWLQKIYDAIENSK